MVCSPEVTIQPRVVERDHGWSWRPCFPSTEIKSRSRGETQARPTLNSLVFAKQRRPLYVDMSTHRQSPMIRVFQFHCVDAMAEQGNSGKGANRGKIAKLPGQLLAVSRNGPFNNIFQLFRDKSRGFQLFDYYCLNCRWVSKWRSRQIADVFRKFEGKETNVECGWYIL